jgi:hypothetical protein
MALLSKCCEGCPYIVREICEKKFVNSKEPLSFVFCDTQNIRLLIEVAN